MECWFCGNKHRLQIHEREYDSAPYLNDDGTPQMICAECVSDREDYSRYIYEMSVAKLIHS